MTTCCRGRVSSLRKGLTRRVGRTTTTTTTMMMTTTTTTTTMDRMDWRSWMGLDLFLEIPKLPVDILLTPTGLEVRERKPCILDTSTPFEMGETVVDLDALTSFPAKIPYGAIKRVAFHNSMVALFVRVLPSQSRRSSGEPQRRIWIRAPHSSSSIQLLVNVLSNILSTTS